MFQNDYLLILLILAPALFFLLRYAFIKRKRDLSRFVSVKNMGILSNVNLDAYKRKNLYIIIAVALMVIALARPQYGARTIMFTQRAADIIVAIDVSRSMLAEDVHPSRIEKAKEVMRDMLSAFRGERIGIIVFEGTAIWQAPMTFDMGAARLFLNGVHAGMMPIGGTRISKPIELAVGSVSAARDNSRILVIITDGEDHDSDLDSALAAAVEKNLRIYTIGIGSREGARIPLRDARGNITDYVRDHDGNIVISALDEETLIKISAATGAQYFRLDENSDITADLITVVKNMTRRNVDTPQEKNLEDRFQFFLFIAFVLLVLDMLVCVIFKQKKPEAK